MNKKIKAALNDAVRQLKKKFGQRLVSVVLFGSHPRGTATKDSDIDLMVVVERLPKDTSKWNDLTLDLRVSLLKKHSRSFDMLLFTPAGVLSNFEACSPIFSTLVLGYDVLYDRNNFFKKNFKNFLVELGKINIRYGEAGKIWHLSRLAKNLLTLQ